MESQLPLAVLHVLRYDDLELDVDTSVPLGYVSESCSHYSRIKHIVRYHLTVLILDCLHDDDLLVAVLDDERVSLSLQVLSDIRDVLLFPGESQRWTVCSALKGLHLVLRGT